MASFTPDLDQLHELYCQYGADLFALCYLQAGRPAQALDLMAASLCDMAASPKLWELAASGKEGFLRVGHLNCVDASLRRPKRPKRKKDTSGQEAPPGGAALLPDGPPAGNPQAAAARPATALFCRERLGLSWEAAAQLLGTLPPPGASGCTAPALKAGENHPRARPGPNLETLSPGEDALDRRLGGIPLPAGAGGLCRPPALPPGPPGYGRGHALPGPGGGGHLRGGLFGGGARLVWPQLRAGAGHSPGELQR